MSDPWSESGPPEEITEEIQLGQSEGARPPRRGRSAWIAVPVTIAVIGGFVAWSELHHAPRSRTALPGPATPTATWSPSVTPSSAASPSSTTPSSPLSSSAGPSGSASVLPSQATDGGLGGVQGGGGTTGGASQGGGGSSGGGSGGNGNHPHPSPTPTLSHTPSSQFPEEAYNKHGVPTFKDHHRVSGPGPQLSFQQVVSVSCKVLDPSIPSVSPDGYWYRIASAPWSNQYYAAANTFLNGDPPAGPYTHYVDTSVPDC